MFLVQLRKCNMLLVTITVLRCKYTYIIAAYDVKMLSTAVGI